MSIKISDSIKVGQQRPLEDKYFNELVPYTSTTQVNTLLVKAVRHIGLTVNINGEEYWYKGGIENENLILKVPIIDLSTKLDRGRYTGTAEDLNDSINNLERINYVWSTTNRTLTLFDGEGNQLSQVSLVSLDNEGTDLRYNGVNKSLELYNADNQLLDSIPVSDFVGNVGTALQLNSNTLQLKDSQGNILSSVSFSVSNISGLQAALDAKESTLLPGTSDQYYRGDKTWQVLNKTTIGLSDVDNTSDANKPVSIAQAAALDTKLNKTTTTVAAPDTTFKYAYLADEDNNVRRMLAGDLGKNIANSNLTSVAGAGMTLGAPYVWNTANRPFSITGLPDKSVDATFDKFVGINSSGQIAKNSGKGFFINIPNVLTAAEKNKWFADMNGETSFSGTSIITAIPPVVQRSNTPQNIIIKGLGLNLVTNFDVTPEQNKSYVGVWHDINNNGIQDTGENDLPAQNYSRVGDNQTIVGQFLFPENLPLGKYKVKIKNAGVPAIGDTYINVVESIESTQITNSFTYNNTSDPAVITQISDTSFSLGYSTQGLTATNLASALTGAILKGNEDWWFRANLNFVGYGYGGGKMFSLGLTSTSDNDTSFEVTADIIYVQGSYINISINGTLNSSAGNQGLISVDFFKQDNVLTIIAYNINNTSIITSVNIDTQKNYHFKCVSFQTNSNPNGQLNFIHLKKLIL